MVADEREPEAKALAPLVRAAAEGDRVAFARLYDDFEPTIYGLAIARVPPHAAQDVVHDVFVTALSKLSTLRDPEAFPGWLASIAKNRITDWLRRPVHDSLDSSHAEPTSGDATEAAGVLEILRTLPEAYAQTLALRFVEGMTGPEIAERTGMTHASVRVNLHRGMKLLREKLIERGDHVR